MNDFISGLAEKIKLNKEAYALALPHIQSGEAKTLADKISAKGCLFCKSEYNKNPREFAPLLLAAALVSAQRVYNEKYRKKGIPDSVYYDTMSDISVWVDTLKREENVIGLKEIGWINNHLKFELFKIVRMQYQFFTTNYIVSGVPILKIHKMTVKNHRSVLNMHIPEGEPLNFDECIKSLNSAQEFFKKYFSEYSYSGFVCDSWLLDPNNRLFMDNGKNIVKFAELFDTVVRTKRDNFEIVKRLWGKKIKSADEIKDFPENTDLQRRTKAYILSGGKTGNGYGTIKNIDNTMFYDS